jgi:isoleucyl-tRNA synthetase
MMMRRVLHRQCVAAPMRFLTTSTASTRTSDDKHNFAHTLLLPKTAFALRSDALEREALTRERSAYERLYSWQWSSRTNAPLWITHDGPPYANGQLHIGHALNKILKDIVSRYKLARGFRVHFVPGWDMHGLPIELKAAAATAKAAKGAKASRTAVDAAAPPETPDEAALRIRQGAADYALGMVVEQSASFRSWAVLGDWERPYLTLQPEYEAQQLGVFASMVARGLIYRGAKPVFWSPSSRTALAEAELEYRDDHVSTAAYVALRVTHRSPALEALVASDPTAPQCAVRLLVWTTTPWTLPANAAVCVGEKIDYVVIKGVVEGELVGGGERARRRAHRRAPVALGGGARPCEWRRLARHDVRASAARRRRVPGVCRVARRRRLGHRPGAHGAGPRRRGLCGVRRARHCAILPGRRARPLHRRGRRGGARRPRRARRHRQRRCAGAAAPERPAAALGALCASLSVRLAHQQAGAAARHGAVVRAADGAARQRARGAALVEIDPEGGRTRLDSMLAARDDWCLSRQRVWGVPIPVFYDVETGEPLMTAETIEHVRALVAEFGSDCWWSMSEAQLLPPSMRDVASRYRKGRDTMDVWFDSGTSWAGALRESGIDAPSDLVLEGSDQHRGWFQSSLLTSVGARGVAPYKRILTHGFVLDERGRKMAKSLGNVVEPSWVTNASIDGRRAVRRRCAAPVVRHGRQSRRRADWREHAGRRRVVAAAPAQHAALSAGQCE